MQGLWEKRGGAFYPVDEEWRPAVGFLNYEVSSHGRVRRTRPHQECRPHNYVLKPFPDHHGYPMVSLWVSGKRHGIKIHKLVAMAFLPNPEGKRCVAHYDGTKDNNHVSNLRWATHKENHADTLRHGRRNRGDRNGSAVLSEAEVVEIAKRLRAGETQTRIATDYGVCRDTIGALKRGRSWRWLTGFGND